MLTRAFQMFNQRRPSGTQILVAGAVVLGVMCFFSQGVAAVSCSLGPGRTVDCSGASASFLSCVRGILGNALCIKSMGWGDASLFYTSLSALVDATNECLRA